MLLHRKTHVLCYNTPMFLHGVVAPSLLTTMALEPPNNFPQINVPQILGFHLNKTVLQYLPSFHRFLINRRNSK